MSENASLIVTATITGIQLFNISSPTPQKHFDPDHKNPMIALSGDGSTLAYAATTTNQNDTTLYLFQTGTLTPTWHTTIEGTLNSLSTSHNGNHTTVTTNQPAKLYLFTKQQQTPLWTYNFGEHAGAAEISNDGNYIIATGGNQTTENNLRVYRFSPQTSQPGYIKIISEPAPEQRLAVASQGTIFTLAFAETNRLIFFNLDLPPYGYGPGSVLNITLPGKPTATVMSSDGKYTAVGTDTGIHIYEYANTELTRTKQDTNNNLHILDIALTPDGQYLAATTPDKIYLFDIQGTGNDTNFWLYIAALAIIILAISTTSVYILRRQRKPQKPTNTK
jgi:WD40 repeat protein